MASYLLGGDLRRLDAHPGDRLGALLADQQLSAERAAREDVNRREAPDARSARGRARSRSSRRRSAPTAVAITVSEPPSTMLRADASALRAMCGLQAVERVDQHDRIGAARGEPPGLIDDRLDRRRPAASSEAAKLSAAAGARLPLAHSEISSGRTPASTTWTAALALGQRARELPERLGLARARRTDDHHPRALAERRQPLDRLQRRVLGPEREPLARERGRQIVEADAVGELRRGPAVDRLDPDQRRESLGAARRALGPRDPVAGHELAALDLRRRDVDVVVGRIGRRNADEARAVGEQLDDALDELLVARVPVLVGWRRAPGSAGRLGDAPAPASSPASASSSAAARPLVRVPRGAAAAPRGRRSSSSSARSWRVGFARSAPSSCVARLDAAPTSARRLGSSASRARRPLLGLARPRRRPADSAPPACRGSRRSARLGADGGNRRSKARRRSRAGRRAGCFQRGSIKY